MPLCAISRLLWLLSCSSHPPFKPKFAEFQHQVPALMLVISQAWTEPWLWSQTGAKAANLSPLFQLSETHRGGNANFWMKKLSPQFPTGKRTLLVHSKAAESSNSENTTGESLWKHNLNRTALTCGNVGPKPMFSFRPKLICNFCDFVVCDFCHGSLRNPQPIISDPAPDTTCGSWGFMWCCCSPVERREENGVGLSKPLSAALEREKKKTPALLRDLHNVRKSDLNANSLVRLLEILQWLWQPGVA